MLSDMPLLLPKDHFAQLDPKENMKTKLKMVTAAATVTEIFNDPVVMTAGQWQCPLVSAVETS